MLSAPFRRERASERWNLHVAQLLDIFCATCQCSDLNRKFNRALGQTARGIQQVKSLLDFWMLMQNEV
jgi:hypothetical protein